MGKPVLFQPYLPNIVLSTLLLSPFISDIHPFIPSFFPFSIFSSCSSPSLSLLLRPFQTMHLSQAAI